MGWLWPLSRAPHSLDYCTLRHASFISSSIYNYGETLTPDGPRLNAYCWNYKFPGPFSLLRKPVRLRTARKASHYL
jgi:hypothetical protein